MVKQKIFLRLGKTESGSFKTDGSLKQKIEPIWSSTMPSSRIAIPTVHFAIEVDIPDEKFDIEKIAVAKINFELEEDRLIVKAVDAI